MKRCLLFLALVLSLQAAITTIGDEMDSAMTMGAEMDSAVVMGDEMDSAVTMGAEMDSAVTMGAEMDSAVTMGDEMDSAVTMGVEMDAVEATLEEPVQEVVGEQLSAICNGARQLASGPRSVSKHGAPYGCDNGFNGQVWYYFSGGMVMPNKNIPTHRCGTHAPGWIRGNAQVAVGGVTWVTVCYHWSGSSCRWSNRIKMSNCGGGKMIYLFTRTPVCHLRYCAEKGPPKKDECGDAKQLSASDRLITKKGAPYKCDNSFNGKVWYYFSDGARMPESSVPTHRCGTHAPGYIAGKVSLSVGQQKKVKVCYHWSNKNCLWSNYIQMKRCKNKYIYLFPRTPVCHLRYCAEKKVAPVVVRGILWHLKQVHAQYLAAKAHHDAKAAAAYAAKEKHLKAFIAHEAARKKQEAAAKNYLEEYHKQVKLRNSADGRYKKAHGEAIEAGKQAERHTNAAKNHERTRAHAHQMVTKFEKERNAQRAAKIACRNKKDAAKKAAAAQLKIAQIEGGKEADYAKKEAAAEASLNKWIAIRKKAAENKEKSLSEAKKYGGIRDRAAAAAKKAKGEYNVHRAAAIKAHSAHIAAQKAAAQHKNEHDKNKKWFAEQEAQYKHHKGKAGQANAVAGQIKNLHDILYAMGHRQVLIGSSLLAIFGAGFFYYRRKKAVEELEYEEI